MDSQYNKIVLTIMKYNAFIVSYFTLSYIFVNETFIEWSDISNVLMDER